MSTLTNGSDATCVECVDPITTDAVPPRPLLKRHKANVHDIGVVWHVCDQPGCEYKAKLAGAIKKHKANVHDIGVVWHVCDQPGCEYKAKQAGEIKVHKAYVHDIGVVWHVCDQPGCEYKAKLPASVKQHKANVHDIDVVWHVCDQPGCEYKAKLAGDIKVHKASVHDIGVVWHVCDQPGCEYKAKRASGIKVHMQSVHARVYAQRKQEQEERVRRALLDSGWLEHTLAEAMAPVGYFRREKRINFTCAALDTKAKNARIDFVLGVPHGYVFLEVDENQHRYGYDASISCDMKRMSHVLESLVVETGGDMPCIYWLRYNPHAWHVGGALRHVLKTEREARLMAWLKDFECLAPLGIGYAFYDCESEEDGGALAVLDNGEYHAHYAAIVDNLADLTQSSG